MTTDTLSSYHMPHDAFILTSSRHIDQFNAAKVLPAYSQYQTGQRATTQPWEVEFHLTGNCSLRCNGCSYATRRTGMELTVPGITTVLNEFESDSVKAVFFSGGGDPFMWKHWDGLLRAKAESTWDFPIGVSSNLVAFKHRIRKPASVAEIDFYQVHILGYDEESCRNASGVNCYRRMRDNLNYLFENVTDRNTVTMKFMLNEHNCLQITDYLDFVSDYPVDSIVIKVQQNFLENKPASGLTADHYAMVSDRIANHKICMRLGITLNNFNDRLISNNHIPKDCHIAKSGMYCLIRENGDVFPCIASTNDPGNALGNIGRVSIKEILANVAKRNQNSNNMIDGKCPTLACRHYRLAKIIEEYRGLSRRFTLHELPVPTLI